MSTEERIEKVKMERFSHYGDALMPAVLGAELLDPKKHERGSIWAHVENSGSEGWYVEIAKWFEKGGVAEWRRYAFQKYLGGEIAGLSDRECADYVEEVINDFHGSDASIVHGMKNWGASE